MANRLVMKILRETGFHLVLTSVLCMSAITASAQEQASALTRQDGARRMKSYDSEQFGKALEYFSGNKYHEALNIFEKLDTKYKLNERFRAYMGICYYYEWEYEKACAYMEECLPSLEVYAPHERSVYYHITAESYFNLGKYEKAIPLYEQQLNVCYDNEKANAYYRIGFCYMLREEWHNAKDYFSSALIYYDKYPGNAVDISARTVQIQKMMLGIDKKIEEKE